MNISNSIENLFLNKNSENIIAIGFGKKYVNNIKTDTNSIVFYVENKLPLNQIPENEIIPNTVNLENISYSTDVVEATKPEFIMGCYSSSSHPDILKLQTNTLPLKGGQELIVFPENFTTNNYSYCTLGFLCVDSTDNKFVAITAAHPIVSRLQIAPNRNLTTESTNPYNTYEQNLTYNGSGYRPSVGIWENKTNTNTPDIIISDYIKKYSNLSAESAVINYTDVAVVSIGNNSFTTQSLINIDSHKIYVPSGQTEYASAMEFATTEELNNLIQDNPIVYSTGRTTGPKGYFENSVDYNTNTGFFCRMYIESMSNTTAITFQNTSYIFGDSILFGYADDPPDETPPVSLGDSGSALIAEYPGGIRKIIGVVFARNGKWGYANRIDKIVQELDIRKWDWTESTDSTELSSRLQLASPSVIKKQINDPINSQAKTTIDNKTYYQSGFSKKRY